MTSTQSIDQQIRALVRDMASANPLWGAPRIHGELRALGVDTSERTVSRLLKPDLGRFVHRDYDLRRCLTEQLDGFTVTTGDGHVVTV